MQDRAATARAGTKAKNASEGFKDCMCFTVKLWVTATSSEHPRLHSIDVIVPLLLSCSIFSPIFPQLTKKNRERARERNNDGNVVSHASRQRRLWAERAWESHGARSPTTARHSAGGGAENRWENGDFSTDPPPSTVPLRPPRQGQKEHSGLLTFL